MAATTFHQFGELPRELQTHIWSFVATPDGKIDETDEEDSDLQEFSVPFWGISALFYHVIKPREFWDWSHNISIFKEACVLRRTMMATCRLAKQVALEAWMRDAKGAYGMTPFFKYLSHFSMGQERMTILGRLEHSIEETQAGRAFDDEMYPYPDTWLTFLDDDSDSDAISF